MQAFYRLGLERIEAACLPENAASIRVLEKAGFHREGYARGYLSIAGTRRDHLLFARLKSDPNPE
jgi:ribosomal-protein-alanine N-acetyltransferase